MKRDSRKSKPARAGPVGPTQRQLRAGELVRHALADILREGSLHDEALAGASVTVTEVRVSPDFRHATCFVESLGGAHADAVVAALNRHARFLRGRLGHEIDLKNTPELKFIRDQSFEEARRMNALFNRPEVKRDLASPVRGSVDEGGSPPDGDNDGEDGGDNDGEDGGEDRGEDQ